MCATSYRLDKENETQIKGDDMFVQRMIPLKDWSVVFKLFKYRDKMELSSFCIELMNIYISNSPYVNLKEASK